jgi:hypothetical protein
MSLDRLTAWRVVALGGSLVAALAVTTRPAPAQEAAGAAAVRVFLDCQTRGCDFDHFRREIRFVNWVIDRADGDVHVLITSQASGAGRAFTLAFIGLGRFEGDDAELIFNASDTDTSDEQRGGLTRAIELGLVRYASQTPLADRLSVTFQPVDSGAVRLTAGETQIYDPWDYWVFRISAGGEYNGESQQRGTSLFGSVSINRTTEALKIRLNASIFYREDQFDFEDETFTSIARSNSASAYAAHSIGAQFATGLRWDIWSSTFSNIDVANRLAWAFEYNVFPYSESTRRELTFLYTVGVNDFGYLETTIYDKLEEQVADHALIVSLDLKQPWGDARFELTGRQYLHDASLYRISGATGVEVRLFRGLSLDVSGWYAAVRDQLSLRAGDASPEEILLFRRELATDFRVGTSLGLTYRFGSIFNNVVNPRLNEFRRP